MLPTAPRLDERSRLQKTYRDSRHGSLLNANRNSSDKHLSALLAVFQLDS